LSTVALELRGLDKTYVRGKPVLQQIDLAIEGTGLTAIIGPSGTGKSTLIRCVNRLVEPTGGRVLLDGEDLTRLRGRALRLARRRIGMVFQEYNLVERLTVIENVLCGRLGHVAPWRALLRRYPQADVDHAFDLLQAVGLDESYANRRADQLSGGQRQRVAIARAMVMRPTVLLADEPTGNLDHVSGGEVLAALESLNAGGISLLVVTHDDEVSARSRRQIRMRDGRIVHDAPTPGQAG
jgi:phosphonate transport system ATP-binding protein